MKTLGVYIEKATNGVVIKTCRRTPEGKDIWDTPTLSLDVDAGIANAIKILTALQENENAN